MNYLKGLAHHAYVPVVSLVLVLALAYSLHTSAFDPLVASQNQRIRFQTGGESSGNSNGLTPTEVSLAESVLEKHRGVPDGKHTELLYIGNSQTIAIMDPKPGDLVSPQWLQVLLARQNTASPKNSDSVKPIEVNLGSLANITAPELLIELVSAGERSPRQVDTLIASVVLEEFRGLGVRDEVAELAAAPETNARLCSLAELGRDLTSAHNSLHALLESGAASRNGSTLAVSHASYAQRLEGRLQHSSESIPLFADRDNLRAQVALGYHEWRNRLLGINSASIRPVPEAPYRASLEMIELALRYAQSAKIQVFLYLAPIRPIQPNPNLPGDVAKFRRDVPALCKRYNVKCLDYVDLVPENLWTNYPDYAVGTEGQRDFAHFTGAAHKLVAEKLIADVGAQLVSISHVAKNTAR